MAFEKSKNKEIFMRRVYIISSYILRKLLIWYIVKFFEYMIAVSWIYVKVLSCVYGNIVLSVFNDTFGVKQGFLFSPNLFGQCKHEFQQKVL